MTTNRCHKKNDSNEQCRLYDGHKIDCLFAGEPLGLLAAMCMQEEAKIAYDDGVREAERRIQEFLANNKEFLANNKVET